MKSVIMFSQGFFPYMDKLELILHEWQFTHVSHMAVSQNTQRTYMLA